MLKIGDKVQFRFFNSVENRFIGEYKTGIIVDIDKAKDKPFLVREIAYPSWVIALHRKEIKRRIA